MAEYIEREVAISAVRHAYAKGLEPTQYIEEIPAADVVEVVRCGECKHSAADCVKDALLCNRKMLGMVRPNDFCSYVERRDNTPYMENWSPETKKLYDDVMESLHREDGDTNATD